MEKKALEILTANRSELDALVEGLLEHETLSKEEIDKILEGSGESEKVKAVGN